MKLRRVVVQVEELPVAGAARFFQEGQQLPVALPDGTVAE